MKNQCKAHDSNWECKYCSHNEKHDINVTCFMRCCNIPGKNVRCIRTDL